MFARLDVTMNNPFGVRRIERVRELNAHIEQTIKRQWAAIQFCAETLALKQLHRDKRLAAVVFHRINRADVGMIQSRCSTSLQQKAVEGRGIASQFRRKKLKRHAASKSEILGFVNHAHPATAQAARDAVMRDGLPDHEKKKTARALILGRIPRASQT